MYTACIEQGHGDCVQLLLDAHADADQEGSNGVTPLIAACRFASLENILLDEELSACLANTGIAKMDAGPEASRAWFRVKRRASYTSLAAISSATDGWALGITLLVTLSYRSSLATRRAAQRGGGVAACVQNDDDDREALVHASSRIEYSWKGDVFVLSARLSSSLRNPGAFYNRVFQFTFTPS